MQMYHIYIYRFIYSLYTQILLTNLSIKRSDFRECNRQFSNSENCYRKGCLFFGYISINLLISNKKLIFRQSNLYWLLQLHLFWNFFSRTYLNIELSDRCTMSPNICSLVSLLPPIRTTQSMSFSVMYVLLLGYFVQLICKLLFRDSFKCNL